METLKFEPFKKLESLEEVENQKLASTLCSLKLNSGFLAFPDKMSGEEQVDASHSNTGTASKTTLPGSAKVGHSGFYLLLFTIWTAFINAYFVLIDKSPSQGEIDH